MIEPVQKKEISQAYLAKARAAFEAVPFVRLIGMQLVDLKDGEAKIKLKMRDELRQPQGFLHGGATASLIDTAMAFAVITLLAESEKATTVDLTVHYLRPVTAGEIVCTAKIARGGQRILTVSAEVVDEKGKLIATSLSTYAKI